jgi:hypothetical protein
VRVLGVEKAIDFLLEFGGAELYIAKRPQERGRLARLIGPVKAAELAEAADGLPSRIPLAKEWLARTLLTQGLPVAEVARRLRLCDIARYFLHGKVAEKDGEVERAYREAVKLLTDISAGRASLAIAGVEPEAAGGGSVRISTPDRVFTRDSLGGL